MFFLGVYYKFHNFYFCFVRLNTLCDLLRLGECAFLKGFKLSFTFIYFFVLKVFNFTIVKLI